MKLLDRYNRVNVAVTVVTMLVTGVIYYYTISHILTNQIDKDLVLEENEIFNYVTENHRLPDVYESSHQQIIFAPLGNKAAPRRFLDTIYKELDDNDMEAGRALISSVKVGGQNYRILVTQSKVETEYLIKIIFLITIGVTVTLLVVLLFLNRIILNRIWQPFHRLLTQLKDFSPARAAAMHSVPSKIDEFRELDQAVSTMASRVQSDYQSLKAFTENASHELMTPIAVINSKLDTLVQTDQFTEKQSKLLNDIYATVARLTRLNKSMLLLSKLENGLIADGEETDIEEVLSECLYQQEEIALQKDIKLQSKLGDKQLKVSRLLLEVLFNNLISNSIRHNYPGGEINVVLDDEKLSISNTGKGTFDLDQALKRFHKADGSEGIGLGLTLCKQICVNYGFGLEHQQQDGLHTFTVTF